MRESITGLLQKGYYLKPSLAADLWLRNRVWISGNLLSPKCLLHFPWTLQSRMAKTNVIFSSYPRLAESKSFRFCEVGRLWGPNFFSPRALAREDAQRTFRTWSMSARWSWQFLGLYQKMLVADWTQVRLSVTRFRRPDGLWRISSRLTLLGVTSG